MRESYSAAYERWPVPAYRASRCKSMVLRFEAMNGSTDSGHVGRARPIIIGPTTSNKNNIHGFSLLIRTAGRLARDLCVHCLSAH